MTQEAIKTRKQAKQNCDDSLTSSKRVYPNMNETEDSNKNQKKIWKKLKQHPDMLDMMKINSERIWILKVDAKQTRLRRVKSESET